MNQNFESVISRMKQTGDLKNDSAVARALNISPQAISNYKRRGRFPAGHIVKFADRYGVSIDWLLNTSGVDESGTGGGEEPNRTSGNLAPLSLEQSIYASRLIRILNSPERAVGEAAKYCIDALLHTAKSGSPEVVRMPMGRTGSTAPLTIS